MKVPDQPLTGASDIQRQYTTGQLSKGMSILYRAQDTCRMKHPFTQTQLYHLADVTVSAQSTPEYNL